MTKIHILFVRSIAMVFAVFLGVFAQAAVANDAIGKVVLSIGDAWAVNLNNEKRDLKRGDDVFSYETLFTGVRSKLHLRFTDGSNTALKADTSFRVAQYYFKEDEPEQGAAVFQLLRGGLRTISGKIGSGNPDKYRLQTALATIGIRGTEYEAYVCDLCCALMGDMPEGVAGGVDLGGISVDTAVGAADLNPGQYFVLEQGADSLQVLDYKPPFLGGTVPEVEPEPVVDSCIVTDAYADGTQIEDAMDPVFSARCLDERAGI